MPLTIGEIVSLVGLAISFASLVYVIRRFDTDKSKTDADMVAERTEQRIRQQDMSGQLTEILDSVRAINAKLDDHTRMLVQHEERISTMFRRIERLESVLDVKYREVGGTDE